MICRKFSIAFLHAIYWFELHRFIRGIVLPPMKAVLDRLVYGMNKYYGKEKGPALWAGKKLAIITTCGYRPENGADLWETGIIRYCKHSKLQYAGMLAERHLGYNSVFMDSEKEEHAKQFADKFEEGSSL